MFYYLRTKAGLIEMENNDVDEKLIKWNDIFEELVIDVNTILKDLSESINYIAIFGALLILLGGANVATALLLGRDSKIIAYSVIIFITCTVSGVTQLQKWYGLKLKYNRLNDLQREMES